MSGTEIPIDWKKVNWEESSVVFPCGKTSIAWHRYGPHLFWNNRILRFDTAEISEHCRYGDTGDYHYVQIHLRLGLQLVAVLDGPVGQIHDDPIAGEAQQDVLAAEAYALHTARQVLALLGLPNTPGRRGSP